MIQQRTGQRDSRLGRLWRIGLALVLIQGAGCLPADGGDAAADLSGQIAAFLGDFARQVLAAWLL